MYGAGDWIRIIGQWEEQTLLLAFVDEVLRLVIIAKRMTYPTFHDHHPVMVGKLIQLLGDNRGVVSLYDYKHIRGWQYVSLMFNGQVRRFKVEQF